MKTSNVISNKVKSLEKQRKKYAKRKRAYKPLKVLIQLLKILIFISGLVASITLFLFPPVGAVSLGVCLVLLLITTYLEKIKQPDILYHNEIMNVILPTVISTTNDTLELVDTFDAYHLQHSLLLDSKLATIITNIIGKINIKGKIENTDITLSEVILLQKKVDYKKSSAGCLGTIIMIPTYIWSFFTDDISMDEGIDLYDIHYKEDQIFKNLFFARAHLPISSPNVLYIVPKRHNHKTFTSNLKLEELYSEHSFIKEHYNIYGNDNRLIHSILNNVIIQRIRDNFLQTGELISISFKDNVLSTLTPLNQTLINTDLTTPVNDTNYFDPLLNHINFFQNYIAEVNQRLDTPIS